MARLHTQPTNSFYGALTGARKATYQLLAAFDANVLKQKNPIVIFSYHSIAKDDWRFSVNPLDLKKQILHLQKHYDIITLKTVDEYLAGKITITKPSAVLTFDDGYKDILIMKDFFKKHNITPVLFVLTNTKRPNLKELGTKRPFLTKRDMQSLIKAGWEIGCHSATHANLATLSDKELKEEIVTSKKSLENDLGITIKYFAYPRGKYNATVARMVQRAKYTMALTMDDGFINTQSNRFTLPRVGVDRTHTFAEFAATFSPSVVRLRKLIKMSPVGRYL
ncbi:MAG: polysaccharide deacetylase family protein [Candidatus Levybacteria bacterium]|nr:polysaccharide deacetylase family protein [Candidatus Levybacteria bacterium]